MGEKTGFWWFDHEEHHHYACFVDGWAYMWENHFDIKMGDLDNNCLAVREQLWAIMQGLAESPSEGA